MVSVDPEQTPSTTGQGGSTSSATNVNKPLLSASVEKLDLGTLPRGGKRETTVRLKNNGATEVRLGEVRTSCECLEVVVDSQLVRPRETVIATVKVDFTTTPKFSGTLQLQAEGRAKQHDASGFVLLVNVEVE